MAFPVILVNATGGSDTAASGAGPATAKTGTGASSTTTTNIDITDVVDLSGVSTAGDAVIYWLDTTAGHRRFARITGVTGGPSGSTWHIGLDANSPVTSGVGPVNWAIGGKRASIGSATSSLLFDNNTAAGDAMPGWVVEMQSAHTETIAATLNTRRAGDTTSGPIILRGTAGAGTPPVVTFSNNGTALGVRGDYQQFRAFELQNSNATKTASVGIASLVEAVNVGPVIDTVKISNSTNKFWHGIDCATGNNATTMYILSCEVGYCAGFGIGANANSGQSQAIKIINCFIHDCGAVAGINFSNNGWNNMLVYGCVIYNNTGAGILYDNSEAQAYRGGAVFAQNTIDSNTTNAIQVNTVQPNLNTLVILNNILSNNGNYGVKFNNASFTDAALAAYAPFINGNDTYLNTSGAYNDNTGTYTNSNCPWASGDPGLNPTYTAASSGDFSIGTNLKAQGFPVGGTLHVGTTSSTYSYVDIGAAQRQEAGGAAGMLYFPTQGDL